MNSMSEQSIWTKNFFSISFVNLFVFISFYALLTTLPLFVMDEWDGTEAQGGLVVTVMLLAAILIRPFSGNILARFGKRKMLLVATILFAVTTIIYLFVNGFVPLLWLRFFHGFSFAIVTTATSAIATDIVPATRRGEGLGYFTMSMNLAIVIGPFLGLTLIQLVSYQMLFVILNIFTIVSVICAFLVKAHDMVDSSYEKGNTFSLHDLFEEKALSISLVGLLIAFSYSSIVSFISVFASSRGLESVSGYFFFVFAVTMLASRPFLGRQFDWRGAKPVIIPCMVLFSIGFIMLSFAYSPVIFLITAGVIGIGYGSLLPFLLALAVEKVDSTRSGYATATFFTMYDSGIALGSFVLGWIITLTGFSNLFYILAVFVILIILMFHLLYKKE
ncbi:MFS transporter [Gracilibacillus sp. YIM 98692]|uniref:MFS transporter n=1 Tax=Gracilibacillus sp. YIM 98692 TaxID=2663532 RepID=UPI001F09E69D|nr:MFS transporter [Gracilibacillus sp. YIM 98692]